MTKKERVFSAMRNGIVDRVPMGFWYHFAPDASMETDLTDEHLRFYHESGNDFIKVMCDGFFNYPNPLITDHMTAADWASLRPAGEDSPYVRLQIERAKKITSMIKGECAVFYNVFNPMSLIRFQAGEDALMRGLKSDPASMMHAFAAVNEDVKALINGLIREAGCDGIYYCVQNAEEWRFTADEYTELVAPAELDALHLAEKLTPHNILHCCGWAGDRNRLEVWRDYPAEAVNYAVYVEKMPLAEGKKFFGGRCIIGGFENTKTGILYSGSAAAVKRETAHIVEEAGSTGLIIGADCTVPQDIDHRRLHWVREELEAMAAEEETVRMRPSR